MLRRYFIAGLLVWLPILITIYVIHLLVNMMDAFFAFMPDMMRPDFLLGYHIPGFELVLTILVVFLSGVLVTNFLGRWLLAMGEAILARIPLVRTIYSATKQVLETVLASKDTSFRKVLLVEYPRAGIWSIAFQTNTDFNAQGSNVQGLITAFVPSAPSPISGFLIMLPPSEVHELKMSVDEALKMIISLGMVVPPVLPAKSLHPEKQKLVKKIKKDQ